MTVVSETSLVNEGVKSYPKALGAVNEFIRLMISMIREVVTEELADLSAAMGNLFNEDELVDYVRPKTLGNPDRDICLGIKIDRIRESGWGLYFLLYWLKGKPLISVSIWLKDTDVADSVFAAFKKMPKNEIVRVWDAGHEIYVSRAVTSDGEEQIPVTLRELTESFSDLWKNAGDLQKVLKHSSKGTAK
jgi:hypothetical protein